MFKPKPYKRPKINLKEIKPEDMQAIPEEVEDLIQVPVYISMKERAIVDEMITPAHVTKKAFREIFIGDEDAAIESIGTL